MTGWILGQKNYEISDTGGAWTLRHFHSACSFLKVFKRMPFDADPLYSFNDLFGRVYVMTNSLLECMIIYFYKPMMYGSEHCTYSYQTLLNRAVKWLDRVSWIDQSHYPWGGRLIVFDDTGSFILFFFAVWNNMSFLTNHEDEWQVKIQYKQMGRWWSLFKVIQWNYTSLFKPTWFLENSLHCARNIRNSELALL